MTKILIFHRLKGNWFSPSMVNRYAELAGISISPYLPTGYNMLKPVSVVEANRLWKEHIYVKWRTSDFTYFSMQRVERDDPNLIRAVEEIIKEEYNGDWRSFSFKIVEIPDDVKWYIETIDTDNVYYEEIVEEHRTWN